MKHDEDRALLASAYTLTEMLVVLVIIGLLAAIVGPRLFSRLDDAKRRTAHVQLTNLETAVDLFRLDVGRLPSQQEGLDALVHPPSDANGAWLGPYLSRDQLPVDPWGHAYVYELAQDGAHFRVVSYGSDGHTGGEGNSADIVVERSAGGSGSVAQR